MSQVEKYEVPGSPLTMAILKTALENMFAAIGDCNRGASAPSNPSEGMLWWDTSGTPTELLKRFTAVAGWVTLFSVNATTGVVTPYRAGSPLGTMAVETATDYVAKSLFNAQTFLAAVDDNTPSPVSVAQNRIIGRKTGNIAALTLTDVLDMIGSAAEGDILYRGADGWVRLSMGTPGQVLTVNSGATAPEYADPVIASGEVTPAMLSDYAAGDIIIHDFGPLIQLFDATSYTKINRGEVFIPRAGVIRVTFTLCNHSGNTNAYARVYRNGLAVGTIRSTTTTATFTEDISGWTSGDLLQIYARGDNAKGNQVQILNAKLKATNTLEIVTQS